MEKKKVEQKQNVNYDCNDFDFRYGFVPCSYALYHCPGRD
jgi:hypothetical protein